MRLLQISIHDSILYVYDIFTNDQVIVRTWAPAENFVEGGGVQAKEGTT